MCDWCGVHHTNGTYTDTSDRILAKHVGENIVNKYTVEYESAFVGCLYILFLSVNNCYFRYLVRVDIII